MEGNDEWKVLGEHDKPSGLDDITGTIFSSQFPVSTGAQFVDAATS